MNERVSGKPSGLAGRLVIEGLLDADEATKAQAAAAAPPAQADVGYPAARRCEFLVP